MFRYLIPPMGTFPEAYATSFYLVLKLNLYQSAFLQPVLK